jgi:hypothetical protein
VLPLVGYLAARANRRGRIDRPLAVLGAATALFVALLAVALAFGVAPLLA